jgi:hypothetical protein
MGRPQDLTITYADPAVRKIKKLPRSQVKLAVVFLVCKRDGYQFDSLIQAWVHSETHGPWEPTDSGSRGRALVRELTVKSYQSTTRYKTAVRVNERLEALGYR